MLFYALLSIFLINWIILLSWKPEFLTELLSPLGVVNNVDSFWTTWIRLEISVSLNA